ncbi:hypothetical protein [Kitasatospora sp. NPDC015120]|uniref:hypothetical protein n=1 Tax=Kitasatospora sp. NPDC015120 TaxID=3364023 RepID=UPI0036F48CC7
MTNDVFSQAVRRANRRMTYSQMEAATWQVGGKEGSRSSAWWNNMANYKMDTPPAPKYLPGIAAVLGLNQRAVEELIAEQWYGVRSDDQIPERLQALVATLRGVDPEDIPLLQGLAQAFSAKYSSALTLESYESK